jgi:hypothetical protein
MATLTNPQPSQSSLPTFEDIQRRAAELLGVTLQRPSDQPPVPPAAPRPRARRCQPGPPDKLSAAAFHGLAGLAVRTLAPHTEAHPASLLLQLLTTFGNMVGRGPHCMVEASRHGLNLFLVLVGDSSKARKGTSWNQIARLVAEVDHPWLSTRVTSVRLTPTGLTSALHDRQPATDRRLLAVSDEFVSVLRTLKRSNGHLSPLLRSAWDSGELPDINMPRLPQANETHISLIGHITRQELASNLNPTEAQNGFANRCLWAWVERSNCLPDGGTLDAGDLAPIARELRRALDWASATPDICFQRDAAAGRLWHQCYSALSQLRPGWHGAATSRAEAQVLRLSAIYAALDSTPVIGLPHLKAALAIWDYCYASAAFLFGMSTGDPVADRILEAVEDSETGLSKDRIRRLFHGHVESRRIDAALEQLVAMGAIGAHDEPTGGRPAIRWSTIRYDESQEDKEFENLETEAELG